MLSILKRIKGKLVTFQKESQKHKTSRYVNRYLKSNDLENLVAKTNELSHSTGVDIHDYVLLHQLIRSKKPHYMLECGTGRSTWIIAHALQQNHLQYGILGKVVSMESVKSWHDEAKAIFPKELAQYVDIRYSEPTTFMYSFIKGTCYSQVPDLPYDIVFVDGPAPEIQEDELYETVNMDFIKVMIRSKIPVTAVIDYRLRTNIAYGIIFGKDKVKFIKPWNVGILENVTKEDMILNGDAVKQKKILSFVTQYKNANPSWINV